jgi:hypothetical protein
VVGNERVPLDGQTYWAHRYLTMTEG